MHKKPSSGKARLTKCKDHPQLGLFLDPLNLTWPCMIEFEKRPLKCRKLTTYICSSDVTTRLQPMCVCKQMMEQN